MRPRWFAKSSKGGQRERRTRALDLLFSSLGQNFCGRAAVHSGPGFADQHELKLPCPASWSHSCEARLVVGADAFAIVHSPSRFRRRYLCESGHGVFGECACFVQDFDVVMAGTIISLLYQ